MFNSASGGVGIGGGYSGQEIHNTAVSFGGGVWQNGDVTTGDVNQNFSATGFGGTANQEATIPIPVGLMNLNNYYD